jgi:hypothetical protein
MLERLLPDQNLVDTLRSVKQNFEKKQNMINEIKKIKGKMLIDKQIIEETRRKQHETEEYHKENVKETEDVVLSKDEYIKIFEKKLKEVEIYVHKNNKNNDFSKYKDFKMNDYIEKNTQYVFKKERICKELTDLNNEINRIRVENDLFEDDVADTSEVRKSELKKNVQNYIKMYKNQCKVIEMRIRLMKNYFNNSCYILRDSIFF